jgi:hypothetical protein
MDSFSQSIIEKIGYYVYLLKDPRNQKVFYVGKGCDNRVFMHASDALNEFNESDKLDTIREIRKSGLNVIYFILRHSLTSGIALEIESAMIDFLGLSELKNKVKGHGSLTKGLKTVDEIRELFEAQEVVISDKVMLIIINKYFSRDLDASELYKFTRYCWHVGKRRENAEFILSVYKGIVREVYKVYKWKPTSDDSSNPKDKGRYFFEGEIANEQIRNKYLGKAVTNYIGARNPIKYVNC